jgi:tRNA 5-methylaminomethyl-2-thiouridine biosynthesis bifunctional protein
LETARVKTTPITPARLDFEDGPPLALDFEARHLAPAVALERAERVFLAGNQLPTRWAGRRRFVVLETGFGFGHNFLATWARWRADPQRCERLHYVAVELHPPTRADLERAHASSPLPEAVAALANAWPSLTCDVHRLTFERGQVELLLALGDAAQWLHGLQASADAIYLDGFEPARNPQMWSPPLFQSLHALAAPHATVATWADSPAVREGLERAGFTVQRQPVGTTQKAQAANANANANTDASANAATITTGRFAPRHSAHPVPRKQVSLQGAESAIVIGAGLAGAAMALALAEQGLEVTVMDSARRPAEGASGNPAGIVRSIINRDDGPHARWHRATALEAERQLRPLFAAGQVPGALGGALRFDDNIKAMRESLAGLGLPEEHVQVLEAAEAGRQAGTTAWAPAWRFAGGWVDPGALVRYWLDQSQARFHPGRHVAALQRQGERWWVLGPAGEKLARSRIVIIANATQASSLAPHALWELADSRGQLSIVSGSTPGLVHPKLPLASSGYALSLPGGDVLCGATHHFDDANDTLRAEDHAHNLRILARLTGCMSPADLTPLGGRVAWRSSTRDRLPVVGPVPAEPSLLDKLRRQDQPRFIHRAPGLFVLTALGSRGISSAPLAARIIAGMIVGAPLPVDSQLLDAVDAARFMARAARKA